MAKKAATFVCLLGAMLLLVLMLPITPAGAAGAPAAEDFVTSSMAVTAGSQVTAHWLPAPSGEFFFLLSPAPYSLPNFGTKGTDGEVHWPSTGSHTFNTEYQWWDTTSDAVSVDIPIAAPGTEFELELFTCTSTACSSPRFMTMTIPASWTTEPYTDAFAPDRSISEQSSGVPTDVTIDPTDNSVWNTGEGTDNLSGISSGSTTATTYDNPTDDATKPFALCDQKPVYGANCTASARSALAERIITDQYGRIWFTQGGFFFPGSSGQSINHSEIDSFDPTTDTFCSYEVPGYDNEVDGVASTISSSQTQTIWFVESWDENAGQAGPLLGSFEPAAIGDGCPGSANEAFTLVGCPGTSCNVNLLSLPLTAPAQITADPTSSTLWITGFWSNKIDSYDIATGQFTSYALHSTNSYPFFGAEPWQIVVDTNYVYAIDYGDSNLIRINPATGTVDTVPIPLTSDTEQGYGLALEGGNLYFTLSDDSELLSTYSHFGDASTFGYVNVDAWEAASAQCAPGQDCAPAPTQAVVYSGLALGSSGDDFRGIAASSSQEVAIADANNHVAELFP